MRIYHIRKNIIVLIVIIHHQKYWEHPPLARFVLTTFTFRWSSNTSPPQFTKWSDVSWMVGPYGLWSNELLMLMLIDGCWFWLMFLMYPCFLFDLWMDGGWYFCKSNLIFWILLPCCPFISPHPFARPRKGGLGRKAPKPSRFNRFESAGPDGPGLRSTVRPSPLQIWVLGCFRPHLYQQTCCTPARETSKHLRLNWVGF